MKKYKIRKNSLADKIRFIWRSRDEILEVLTFMLYLLLFYAGGALICQSIK